MTLALIALAYVVLVAFAVALFATARRADDAADRQHAELTPRVTERAGRFERRQRERTPRQRV